LVFQKNIIRKMQKLSALMIALFVGILFWSAVDAQAQVHRYRVGYKDQGFTLIPEIAALIPSNTYPLAINFNMIAGYQIDAHWFVGGGVALDAYGSDVYVPVFADARYNFLDGKYSPYAFIDAGYGLPVDADPLLKGGPMINPGFGIKYFLTRTTAINLSLAYRYQSMPVDQNAAGASTALRTNYIQSLGVRVGLQF
jgi:hypothetical protein